MKRTLPQLVLLFGAAANSLANSASAQVSVKATTATKMTAGTTYAQLVSVPKGTDITAGLNLATPPNLYAGARVKLTNSYNPTSGGSITIQESGRVDPWKGSAWTGESSTKPHSLEIVYTAPRATRARLTLAYTGGAQTAKATYTSSIMVSGLGTVTPGSYDVTIQGGGLIVGFTGRGYATSYGKRESFDATWTITLMPFTCSVSSYGARCGASLIGSTVGNSPVLRFSLKDSSRPTRGFLGLGLQRISVPIPAWGGCSLYVDPLVVLPVGMSLGGIGALDVPLPPIPNLRFYAQGVTGRGQVVHTSNGLYVVCQ